MITKSLKVGEILLQNRLEARYSIQDVSAAINIRPPQIRAIEASNYEALPEMIYAVGFVKVYADFLELDVESIANQFKLEHAEQQVLEDENVKAKKTKKIKEEKLIDSDPFSDNRIPSGFVVIVALVFFIVCASVWSGFKPIDNKAIDIMAYIPPPPEIEIASADISIDEIVAEAQIEVEDTLTDLDIVDGDKKPIKLKNAKELDKRLNTSRVKIRATSPSWIQITNTEGAPVFKKVLRKGDEYFVPNKAGFKLSTSNAGALEIYVDGQASPALGNKGDVIRGISLNPEALLKTSPRVKKNAR